MAAFATQSKPGRWCLLELASEKTWWHGKPDKPKDKGTASHRSAMVPATEPLSLGQQMVDVFVFTVAFASGMIHFKRKQEEDHHHDDTGKQHTACLQLHLPAV